VSGECRACIRAGERWDDGSLRPCLEDLLGAGAVLAEMTGTLSPEAEAAVSAFAHFRQGLVDAICQCGSGKELIRRGFAADVELAAEYAVSRAAPVLAWDRFVDGCPRKAR
jgi:2-phosphosulfolactate phosphatase